jgi:hypothetical protein
LFRNLVSAHKTAVSETKIPQFWQESFIVWDRTKWSKFITNRHFEVGRMSFIFRAETRAQKENKAWRRSYIATCFILLARFLCCSALKSGWTAACICRYSSSQPPLWQPHILRVFNSPRLVNLQTPTPEEHTCGSASPRGIPH